MSEVQPESPKVAAEENQNDKTPVKRTPSKRKTTLERAQAESEQLLKTMGGNIEMEGGRRTRSSSKASTPSTKDATAQPPAKKARNAPSTPTSGRRGRPKKLENHDEPAEDKNNDDDDEKPEENNSDVKTTDSAPDGESETKAENKVDEKPADEKKEEDVKMNDAAPEEVKKPEVVEEKKEKEQLSNNKSPEKMEVDAVVEKKDEKKESSNVVSETKKVDSAPVLEKKTVETTKEDAKTGVTESKTPGEPQNAATPEKKEQSKGVESCEPKISPKATEEVAAAAP